MGCHWRCGDYTTMSSFNPIDFYDFANQIYKNQKTEVAYRTAINRAYYSAFLSAREISGIRNSSGSVHRDVLSFFEGRNKKIFNRLKDLLNLRHQADYLLTSKVNKQMADQSLRLAKSILIDIGNKEI